MTRLPNSQFSHVRASNHCPSRAQVMRTVRLRDTAHCVLHVHVFPTSFPRNWLEYADWWNAILPGPLHIEKGLAVDDICGSWVEWNEEAASRFGCVIISRSSENQMLGPKW